MSTRLEDFRLFYARYVTAVVGIPALAERLASAFASVPREQFLGKGPWRLLTHIGYITTPSDDPAFVYQDIVFALSSEGPFNNGEPTLHARCLAAANPANGDTVLHIGAGTGYYTAILSRLIGDAGSVIAFEIERPFVERALTNLASFPNATVHHRSGSEGSLPLADVIYVNAGATAPLDIWLDALRPGGRLVFPLTPAEGLGAVLLVTRKFDQRFSATTVSPAMFIPCIGARDDETAHGLTEAFRGGGIDDVKSLHRNSPVDETCWFAGKGWWLSTASTD